MGLLLQTAGELGLISALTVLALYLSYSMLNVCDLSTDGCFTLGATVGAVVAISGHPYLSIPAAMAAGIVSGFVTAFLQTKMGVNSLLAGIIVNTALYSVNIAVMGKTSQLSMNRADTVFTKAKDLLDGTFLAGQYKLIVAAVAVIAVCVVLALFLKTKLGLAIRATVHFPPRLYGCAPLRYARIHAQIRFVGYRCFGYICSVSQKQVPDVQTQARPFLQQKEVFLNAENLPYLQDFQSRHGRRQTCAQRPLS